MRCGKTVTEKKLAANRLNSKRSTGPRTQRGKDLSKFNAVRTGLFAKHVVIPVCDGEGSGEQFTELLADIRQEFHPEGTFEDFCVVQIAECMWRFRRATRAEKGSARNARWDRKPPEGWELAKSATERLRIVEDAQEEIKTTGTLSPGVYAAVSPVLPLLWMVGRNDMAQAEEAKGPTEPKIDDFFLFSLKAEIETCRHTVDFLTSTGDEMVEDHFAENALPPEQAMNKILRYEKAAQNKFDWALQRLLESQQRRQKAQAPASVQVRAISSANRVDAA